MTVRTVAVFGLGAMGAGIAQSVLRSGFDVVGHDISEAARDRFVGAGGRTGDPNSMLADSDVVILSLLNDEQIASVLFDGGGNARRFKSGAIVLCTSTVPVDFVVSCGKTLAEAGVGLLDAPVSGGPVRAASGDLVVYLSGAPDNVERAKGVLDSFAKPLYIVGSDPGQGTSFKLVNQILAAGNLAVACQAAAFAEGVGLDLPRVLEVITQSAGNSWIFQNMIPRHAARDYEPRSALSTFLKDIRIVKRVAETNGIYNPVGNFIESMISEASSEERKNLDGSILAKYLLEHRAD